jgi:hypothetical protein
MVHCCRGTKNVISLNKDMGTLDVDIPDLLINPEVGDSLFKEKRYIIRPDLARFNDWQVVYMRPWDGICSDYPQTLCGGTYFKSFAWNACQIASLTRYYEVARHRRQQMQALVAMESM